MKKFFSFISVTLVAVLMVACGDPVAPKPEGGSEGDTIGGSEDTTVCETFERTIVLEQFTSQYCVGCPQGDEQLHQAVSKVEASGKKVVWIAHHVGYKDDTMSVVASNPYTFFFGNEGTYNPAAMVDRTDPADVGVVWSDYSPLFASYEGTVPVLSSLFAIYDGSLSKFAAVSAVCSCSVECSLNGNDLTVNVSGKFGKAVEGAAINVFLLQDSLVMYQDAAPDNIMTHMNVLRHSLTPSWGDAIKLSAKNEYTATYTYTIPESITGTLNVPIPVVLDHLSVAAFVSTHTNNVKNSKILNGDKCKVVK